MIRGHGGDVYALADALGCPPDDIVDMSSNVNPFGPPPGLVDYLKNNMQRIQALPEVDARRVVVLFAERFGITPDQVLAGNGTTQLIYDLPRALETRLALIIGPTYADYRDGCRRNQVDSACWLTRKRDNFQPDLEAIEEVLAPCDTVYICNPNNPTGALVEGEALRRLSLRFPDKTFVVDESYLPFVPESDRWSLMRERPENVLVLHSMSKIFRIPGLRIGFAVGAPGRVDRLRRFALPWSVNALAMAAVDYLLTQNATVDRFVADTVTRLAELKRSMMRRLAAIPGVRVYPSATGFFLVQLPDAHRSGDICRRLAREKFLIRDCANFKGLSDRFIRISLQDQAKNKRCAELLETLLTT